MPCIMAAVYSVLTVARFDTESDVEEIDMASNSLNEWLRVSIRSSGPNVQ